MMKREFQRFLESHREEIVHRWSAILSNNLHPNGSTRRALPNDLIEGIFACLLYLLDVRISGISRGEHLLLSAHLWAPDPPQLSDHLEFLLSGKETLEDFLLESEDFYTQFPLAQREDLIENVHEAFHQLIDAETRRRCSQCFRPLKNTLQSLFEVSESIEKRKGPP